MRFMIATTAQEIGLLKKAGKRLAAVLGKVADAVTPGVKTNELNALAERLIREGNDTPAFLNYAPRGASYPYPATLCVSVNNEVVHGIPGDRVLKTGDIVGLDLGLIHEGYVVDSARTVAVGKIGAEAKKLMDATREALGRGIEAVRPGNHVSDISAAVEAVALAHGLGIVRELGGHGVGKSVQEPPFIPNFTLAGESPRIEEGMVLAIEPMFNLGAGDVKLAKDEYTFLTADGSLSAHFEHTVMATKKGPLVLTHL